MEDNLRYFRKGKNKDPTWKTTSIHFVKGRRPQFNLEMEDDLLEWKMTGF
jgi:hypothetical protein